MAEIAKRLATNVSGEFFVDSTCIDCGTCRLMHASKSVCWYDWERQTASMQRLLAYRFAWLLPGHGTRCRLPEKEMAAEVAAIVKRMKET